MASTRKRVETAILDKLRKGDLKPGERISHLKLAQELGVSSNPVVHAFRRLEGIGVLEHTPSGSTRVVERTPREVYCGFVLRQTIEGLAARFCAELCTDEEMAVLNVRVEKLEQRIRAKEWDYEGEQGFHGGIVEFSHTPFLQMEYSRLRLVELATAYARKTGGVGPFSPDPGHSAVMEAICRRDAGEAERLMRIHLGARLRKFAVTDMEMTEWIADDKGVRETVAAT